MVFSDEEYKILALADFDNETLNYSKMFRDHDCCSSHDFVGRWNQLEETFWTDTETMSMDENLSVSSESSFPQPACSSTPIKVTEGKKDDCKSSIIKIRKGRKGRRIAMCQDVKGGS